MTEQEQREHDRIQEQHRMQGMRSLMDHIAYFAEQIMSELTDKQAKELRKLVEDRRPLKSLFRLAEWGYLTRQNLNKYLLN